jgi:hypothetical protein
VAATAATVVEHATLFRISFVAVLVNVTCFLRRRRQHQSGEPAKDQMGGGFLKRSRNDMTATTTQK